MKNKLKDHEEESKEKRSLERIALLRRAKLKESDFIADAVEQLSELKIDHKFKVDL